VKHYNPNHHRENRRNNLNTVSKQTENFDSLESFTVAMMTFISLSWLSSDLLSAFIL